MRKTAPFSLWNKQHQWPRRIAVGSEVQHTIVAGTARSPIPGDYVRVKRFSGHSPYSSPFAGRVGKVVSLTPPERYERPVFIRQDYLTHFYVLGLNPKNRKIGYDLPISEFIFADKSEYEKQLAQDERVRSGEFPAKPRRPREHTKPPKRRKSIKSETSGFVPQVVALEEELDREALAIQRDIERQAEEWEQQDERRQQRRGKILHRIHQFFPFLGEVRAHSLCTFIAGE